MLPNVFLRSFREKKRNISNSSEEILRYEEEEWNQDHAYSVPFNGASISKFNKFGGLKKSMTTKASNLSHLIRRVKASCLLHPLAGASGDLGQDDDERDGEVKPPRGKGMEILMDQVFDAVSSMKRAYVGLQEAHCTWDPEQLRFADMAVVGEIRRLGLLREQFRRNVGRREILREITAPYEAAAEALRREVKAKKEEVQNLQEKLKAAAYFMYKGRSKRRVSCITQVGVAPASEAFQATMSLVQEASKTFTSLLLSLMRRANWDVSAAARSIAAIDSTAGHAHHALESYVNKKTFQGFNHEDFCTEGLTQLGHSPQTRADRLAQFRDMKAMHPIQLLAILPTCDFGNFCVRKYLSLVHPKMEESLFGNLDQRQQLLAGRHPRSRFYGEFLEVCKAVWLLHLLAFALEPPPSHFEAGRGAEFREEYMESVVRTENYDVCMVVGFLVSPGFKLNGNGDVIKARVYLIPST